MYVTFKSFCKGKAGKRTSKILSSYFEYTGKSSWEGHISWEGLSTVQTLINASATKHTKVICKYRGEPYFTIGKVSLSDTGSYKRFTTRKGYSAPNNNLMKLKQGLVGVAGLWHDLGKAGNYFQRKLRGKEHYSDPVRHEWVSSVLVKAYAETCDWLSDDFKIVQTQHVDKVFGDDELLNSVLWLINTHHKKAIVDDVLSRSGGASLSHVFSCIKSDQGWLNYTDNMEMCYDICTSFITEEYLKQLNRYRKKLKESKYLWDTLSDDQKVHLLQECRVAMMLGDSSFSASSVSEKGELYANKCENGKLKQTLTQHLLGVTDCALKALHMLHNHKPFKANTLPMLQDKSEGKFSWQNYCNSVPSDLDNMFCINLASTGRGKTLFNLKLLNRFGNLRCSVGLGMVSLTKQTTKQFREAGIDYNSMAMVTGFKRGAVNIGSESLDQDEVLVDYHGQTSSLSGIFPNNNFGKKNNKILSAPILVTTTDHLVKSVGVKKGNRHMLPFVRSMQSDLVLDEIDDYGIEDMKVLAKLVYLTASYGNKVIISSATITPAISEIFFEAYSQGYQIFCENNGKEFEGVDTVWVDEFGMKMESVIDQFQNLNTRFVNKRIKNLVNQEPKHIASVVDCDDNIEAIKQSIQTLHSAHKNDEVSFGLIRTTTIKDCVAVTKMLQEWDTDLNIKLICYHSRFVDDTKVPMEEYLSKVLNRKNETYKQYVDASTPAVYIVVATPVVEVGRDFDFDWAIIEPSSERSIVQCAGRVLRHRDKVPTTTNIHILQYPFKYYRNSTLCYNIGGYESKGYKLKTKNMLDLYEKESIVNSVNRLKGDSAFYTKRLTALEHKVLQDKLSKSIADDGVFVGSWQLTANPHEYCKWRRGTKNEDLVLTQGEWEGKVVTTKPTTSKIWRKWNGENGKITVPEYLLSKSICYNDFYGGYEEEE